MDAKETYRERIEAALREWKVKADQLKTEVEKAGADAKLKYEKYLPTLRAKREQAERKLEELRTASEGTWENVKAGVEHAWSEFGQVAESAIARFRPETSETSNREEEIRLIAYQLWENEGRPQGPHLEHWIRAESLWREQQGREHTDDPAPALKRRRKRREGEAQPRRQSARQKKSGSKSDES